MDDRQLEAYLNLMRSLLNCPWGEENQILQANSELVDAGLVQVMLEEANNLRIDNNLDDANSLMTLAGRLMGTYGNTMPDKSSPSTYLTFLTEVLQVTADSKGERQVIYDVLRDNLNLVNDNLAGVLRNWAAETLPNLDSPDISTFCTLVVIDFSNAIQQFPWGSKVRNVDIAIAGYEVAMTIFTRQEYPEYWAGIQNNLGLAYLYRIRGERADNLEMAIEFFQASLSVYTHKAFPCDWARSQNNLGLGYLYRIRGESVDNLEMAIEFFQAALSVYTRNAFPFEWAGTQNNLGEVYRNRIKGEKADNLERSIGFYQAALSVYTPEEFPENWAGTQNNLGEAYRNRIRGEKADNLESSLKFYQAALSVYTREAFPEDWAMSQNNLALAYSDRIRGEKADNIEKSIELYQTALSVYTRDAFPLEWARSQNNLGEAYRNRIRGKKTSNIEKSIKFYQASLSVYTRDTSPFEWARSKNNLAGAYLYRIKGKKANNLERSIEFFQSALSVRTRDAYPINHAETLFNLGLTYRSNSQLPQAYNTFKAAIETVESMRSEIIIGGEADRQKLAEEYNRIYHLMVEVCLDRENKTAALEYIERTKTRNLVELFHNARSLPQNVQRISFQEIRSLLGEDEAILEWYITFNGFKVFIITHDSTQPDVWQSSDADLEALRDFANEYINDYIYQNDNWEKQLEIRLEKLAKILHIDEIISRLPENCQRLILVPFVYLHLLPLHALTSRRLKQNIEETGCLLDLFPGGVRYTPSCQLLQLSQRVNPTGEDSSPTRLFAIQNPTEDLDFTDIEVEAIAKSFHPAEVLIREKASKTELQQQLAALQNADIAHFSCHGFFDFSNPRKSALILAGAKVTPLNPPLPRGETGEDFPLARGETGEDFPLPSGETGEDFSLVSGETEENPPLTKGGLEGLSSAKSYIRSRPGETFDIAECLTLEEIFNLSLSKCSLVTLSACETGLTDIRDNTDEYIGLPSGFLYAGATSIISTLWAVNDVSTAILMIRFYELFLSETRPPVAIALRESQLWLRSLTVKALLEWVEASKLLSSDHKEVIKKKYKRGYKQDYQPYEKPIYWAAFCATGQ
jgi:CHAT domain-containing protein